MQADGISIPERHLGLHMPGEASLPGEYISKLAQHMEAHVDADALLKAAASPEFPESSPGSSCVPDSVAPCCRVGVARDAAFCFYYHE